MSTATAPAPATALPRAARPTAKPARPGGWPRRVTRWVGNAVLVAALAGFGLLAVGPHVLGYRTATMLTGSMAPAIEPGDIVVAVQRPAGQVAVGDVITYHIPVEDHRVETHRVVEVTRTDEDAVAVRTKGDANKGADPWTAVLEGDQVWEVKAVVPYVGDVIRALRTPVLHDLLVYGGGGLVVLTLLVGIWSRPSRPTGSA